MTHMWFVMHQPHAGNPKNNPIKASYMAKASVLSWPLPGLSLFGVGVGCTAPKHREERQEPSVAGKAADGAPF